MAVARARRRGTLGRPVSQKLFPPLPPELVRFVESGLSMLVATRGANLQPNAARAVGFKVGPDACHATLYLAAATSGGCAADLREGGPIAVTLSWPATHETVQIKGTAGAVREAAAEDRPFVENYREQLARALTPAGILPTITRRLRCWPALVVDLEIHEVFVQTPGPGAGARMSA